MDLGLIRKVDLDSEMQQSYLDYAMSVIVSRALPDARDGLKPVQRRILYSMYDMGLRADSSYKKSARIVGEVLGKYHPHGDMAVYEAMARMAQDFSMRYPLVDGQGNFGSVDGDPPAAMRYTEARLAAPAMEVLLQLEKNTVDFSQNFDQSLEEPVVLPAAIPNLLVNGATGIAVGMATNIPPHNLSEVIDAIHFMLGQWEKLDDISVEDLLKFIQGPDFPTGGVIIQEAGAEGLMSAYGSGRGRITVQARAHMEEMVRGRNRIIVTELPYQVNKSSLIERIAELVRGGNLDGIADLRDESDRQGMRIVIELSKTADPEKILRDLYKYTQMQTTFGINLLALVEGEPRLLSLKQALRVYIEHRLVVIRRRSEFDLARARARQHILEGLLIALQNLDEVIAIIRAAPDAEQAKLRLIKRFKLSEIQAQAILDMQLRRLASLERKKIDQEHKEVTTQIKDLETLLKSPKKMRQVVDEELANMKEKYGDRRRTLIMQLKEGDRATSLLTTTDITPAQEVWVAVTANGIISRTHDDHQPTVNGSGAPRWLIHTNTHHTLYLVSEEGRAAAIPVHAVPEAGTLVEGASVAKITPLEDHERLAGMFTLAPHGNGDTAPYVLTVSEAGMVKKSQVDELPGPSAHAFILTKVNEGDTLMSVQLTHGEAEELLVTSLGMAIRFSESEIRPMGLVAAGVGGIKLTAGDYVTGASLIAKDEQVFMVTSTGRAKRVPAKEFPLQGRYGQGVAAWKQTKDARVVGIITGKPGMQVAIHLENAPAREIRFEAAPLSNRAGQGSLLVDTKSGVQVTAISGLPIIESETAVTPTSNGTKKKPIVKEVGKPSTKGVSISSKKSSKTAKPSLSTKKTSPKNDGKPTTRVTKLDQKNAPAQLPLISDEAIPGDGKQKLKAVPPAVKSIKNKSSEGGKSAVSSDGKTKPASRLAKPASKTPSKKKQNNPGQAELLPVPSVKSKLKTTPAPKQGQRGGTAKATPAGKPSKAAPIEKVTAKLGQKQPARATNKPSTSTPQAKKPAALPKTKTTGTEKQPSKPAKSKKKPAGK